jgi:hypothetical protein
MLNRLWRRLLRLLLLLIILTISVSLLAIVTRVGILGPGVLH